MLSEEKLPLGTILSYVLLFAVALIVQIVMIVILGYQESDQIRIGAVSNLLAYGSGFVLLYVLFFKYLKVKFIQSIKNYKETILYIFVGFTGLFVLASIITKIYELFGITATPENQETLNMYADALMFDKVALIIFAVVLAPFVEEMVFRLGMITGIQSIFKYSDVNKKIVSVVAIIITSFIFGFVHVVGDIEQIFNYAVLGIVLGLVYYKTDNIYTSVFVHMIYNGVAAYYMFA
jgi:membrane protease YdiL (CAAX protease family)